MSPADTRTACAFGAWMRNVISPSAATSGETYCGGRAGAPGAAGCGAAAGAGAGACAARGVDVPTISEQRRDDGGKGQDPKTERAHGHGLLRESTDGITGPQVRGPGEFSPACGLLPHFEKPRVARAAGARRRSRGLGDSASETDLALHVRGVSQIATDIAASPRDVRRWSVALKEVCVDPPTALRGRIALLAALVVGQLVVAPVLATAQQARLQVIKAGGRLGQGRLPALLRDVRAQLRSRACSGDGVHADGKASAGASSRTGAGTPTVTDGVVTLSGDRRCVAHFDSGTPLSGGPDFNRDGHSDLLWLHPAGWVTAWLLDEAGLLGAASVYTGATDWRPVGSWRHGWRRAHRHRVAAPAGLRHGLAAPGNDVVNAVALNTQTTQWRVVAVTDMNADGQADVVWQSAERGGGVADAGGPTPGSPALR